MTQISNSSAGPRERAPRRQTLQSYHILCGALTLPDANESTLLAYAVRRVVHGFVAHRDYALAAQSAVHQNSFTIARRQLALVMAIDANPIAALFPPETPGEIFESRWNALNQAAQLGVMTQLNAYGTNAAEIRRIPKTEEPDQRFRGEMMSHCLELLSGRRRTDTGDDGQALKTLSTRLGSVESALHEVIELLYSEPAVGIDQCAIALGSSVRTLQRQLARHSLPFALIKQAARITIAGHRIRTREESLAETAQVAGFFDSAHMIHAWRTACGVPPSIYRSIAELSAPAR